MAEGIASGFTVPWDQIAVTGSRQTKTAGGNPAVFVDLQGCLPVVKTGNFQNGITCLLTATMAM